MAPYEQATKVAQRFCDFAKIFAKKCVRILADYDLRGHEEDGVHACILCIRECFTLCWVPGKGALV